MGAMPGVREGIGEGVTGVAPPNPVRREKVGSGQVGNKEDGDYKPRTYRMAFPSKAGPRPFPFEGYSGQATMRMEMRVHF